MQKSTLQLTLLSLLLAVIIGSCKSNDPAADTNKSIQGKWDVKDSNSLFESFEFHPDGYYLAVRRGYSSNSRRVTASSLKGLFARNTKTPNIRKSDSGLSPIHFGKYKIDGNKITLTGFGVVEVVTITEEEFNFSFTLESTGQKDSYVVSKNKNAISSSTKTDQLCKVWEIEKIRLDVSKLTALEISLFEKEYGSNWQEKLIQEFEEDAKGSTVLFSKAGTYLVLYEGESEDAGLAEWKWTSTAETAIYYSWDNWEAGWEESPVSVTDLTNSKVSLTEEVIIYDLKRKN